MTASPDLAADGPRVLVWDLETVPVLAAVSRINGRDMTDAEAEEYLGVAQDRLHRRADRAVWFSRLGRTVLRRAARGRAA